MVKNKFKAPIIPLPKYSLYFETLSFSPYILKTMLWSYNFLHLAHSVI